MIVIWLILALMLIVSTLVAQSAPFEPASNRTRSSTIHPGSSVFVALDVANFPLYSKLIFKSNPHPVPFSFLDFALHSVKINKTSSHPFYKS
jgi:hypothetical protein